MNYIQKLDEALILFNTMPRVMTEEKLQAIEEQHKGNDVVEYLFALLKDPRVFDEEGIEIQAPVSPNEGNVRLQNYVQFKKGMEKIDTHGPKVMCYILRNTDELEQNMYLSILQKTIMVLEPEEKVEEKPKPKTRRKKTKKAEKPAE